MLQPYGRAIVARVIQLTGIDSANGAAIVADSGGVFGVAIDTGLHAGDRPAVLAEGMLAESIRPLASAISNMLLQAETRGRAVVDLWCMFPGNEPIHGPARQPFDRRLHASRELTVPADEAEIEALAASWHRELQREMGLARYEDSG